MQYILSRYPGHRTGFLWHGWPSSTTTTSTITKWVNLQWLSTPTINWNDGEYVSGHGHPNRRRTSSRWAPPLPTQTASGVCSEGTDEWPLCHLWKEREKRPPLALLWWMPAVVPSELCRDLRTGVQNHRRKSLELQTLPLSVAPYSGIMTFCEKFCL